MLHKVNVFIKKFNENEEPYALRFTSIILQYTTATIVLTAVATIPAPTIPAGFTLPYWLRYAITFTGINCSDEILIIKNVHISLLAIPFFLTGPGIRPDRLSSSSLESCSIALSPAGVAAHPSPRMLACVKVGLKIFRLCIHHYKTDIKVTSRHFSTLFSSFYNMDIIYNVCLEKLKEYTLAIKIQ